MILVQLDSAAIQWIGKETLPGTTYKDKHNRRYYFHTNICNSIRFVIVTAIISVDIIVVDVILLHLLLCLHISVSSSSSSSSTSSLLPSYWACTDSGQADTPIQFQSGGLISHSITVTVLPVLSKTSGNDCMMWWKLHKEN